MLRQSWTFVARASGQLSNRLCHSSLLNRLWLESTPLREDSLVRGNDDYSTTLLNMLLEAFRRNQVECVNVEESNVPTHAEAIVDVHRQSLWAVTQSAVPLEPTLLREDSLVRENDDCSTALLDRLLEAFRRNQVECVKCRRIQCPQTCWGNRERSSQ